MNPIIHSDHETMSRAAARWLMAQVRRQPASLLCLATGGTPTRTYDLFAAGARRRPEAFRQLRVLKLDEWGGLPMDDPATCEAHLQRHIVGPLALGARYTGFQSQPRSAKSECARIERWLKAHGPLELCVLGLGVNGHLAFNEPGDSIHPAPHVARLSPASLRHAMLAETTRRPRYGLSLGMANILQATRILLLVSGASKRRPLARLLRGDITTDFPASFLWLHDRVTLMCDRAALP